MTYKMILLEYI